ncbi:YjfA family protein [Microbacterium sp. VKM Ac-2923]|nr:YjfA family protein [Microbacterium sp. VKM Ac-2923]
MASLVKALGDDPGPWLERRDQLALNATDNSSASELQVEKARPRRLIPLRAAAIAAAGAFGAGIIGTVGVVALLDGAQSSPSAAASPADPTLSAVTTGVDPATTPCIEDAEPAAAETRNESYLLEVIWSENCDAAWGRVTRYDNRSSGNSVHVEISPRDGDEGHQKQQATIGDVQGAYTALIIRADGNTRLCARGSVTVDGATIDLGDPLCI